MLNGAESTADAETNATSGSTPLPSTLSCSHNTAGGSQCMLLGIDISTPEGRERVEALLASHTTSPPDHSSTSASRRSGGAGAAARARQADIVAQSRRRIEEVRERIAATRLRLAASRQEVPTRTASTWSFPSESGSTLQPVREWVENGIHYTVGGNTGPFNPRHPENARPEGGGNDTDEEH